MTDALNGGTARQELVDVIRQVRSRWRQRMLLPGRHHRPRRRAGRARPGLATASRPTSSVRRRSPGSASACSRVFALLLGLWLVRPLGRTRHRPAGRALRRGARAVAAGRDSERRRHRRRAADAGDADVPRRHRRARWSSRPSRRRRTHRRRPRGRPQGASGARARSRSAACRLVRAAARRRTGVPPPGRVGAARCCREAPRPPARTPSR